MKKDHRDIVAWFRSAAPYIKSQRGNIFVIYLSGQVAADSSRLPGLIADIALLHSLGIKLVLVCGARPRIEQRLIAAGIPARHAGGFSITDAQTLALVKETIAATRLDMEAALSMEPVDIPAAGPAGGHNARIRVSSGNFIIGRPIGVRGGVDFGYTGEVRRVDGTAIRTLLDGGHIVLISPLGFSPTGEIFNLNAPDVATGVATSLPADKLLLLDGERTAVAPSIRVPGQIDLSQARTLLEKYQETGEAHGFHRHLGRAVEACRSGVRRVHLMDHHIDGALLLEVYTRDGVGVMVSSDAYDTMRRAVVDDIAGIIKLIAPLEEEGVLVRRSREKLESEIERFHIVERDGAIIACAAAYPHADGEDPGAKTRMMELACLAVHGDYRNAQCGNALLATIEKEARGKGTTHLFVLTTHAEHWFLEHGFSRTTLNALPRTRQRMYNESRKAKVLVKAL